MRLLLSILLVALFSFIAGLFLPWWSLAIIAFAVGLLVPLRLWKSFLAGFLGIFLLWLLLALWLDLRNEQLLSLKIAELMHVPSPFLLLLITALVGGLVGGFASLSGASLRANR
jgi:hypothetical protein